MKKPRPRDTIKDLHENASIQESLDILNLDQNKHFKIVERPDPPDAIIFNGENYSWLEHTDAFRSAEEAQELLSFVTPDEPRYQRKEQLIYNPDLRIASAIKCQLIKKLEKISYKSHFEKYGKGILIINVQDFLFSESSLVHVKKEINKIYSPLAIHFVNQDFFKKVYLKFRLSAWVKDGLMTVYPELEPPIIPPDVLPNNMIELQKKLENTFWGIAHKINEFP